MVKYSIIIPVYNTEKYLKKCLDSVINQTYKDFEIILVNDGSTDNSDKIIKDYLQQFKNIKYIKQKNQGLSCARNVGVENANGEYIIFLDSDDYLNTELLSVLNTVKNDPELIRYQVNIIYNGNQIEYKEKCFDNLDGKSAFDIISSYKYVELACLYAIKKTFYTQNNYKFMEGCYHEDFGLIPRIIIESDNVTSIDYIGYNYIQRDNSIMNNFDYEKEYKKTFDMLKHYDYLVKTSKLDKLYLSFISNSVILKAKKLNNKDQKKYIKELKDRKIFNNILSDTLLRKIKRILLKINLKLYFKVIK